MSPVIRTQRLASIMKYDERLTVLTAAELPGLMTHKICFYCGNALYSHQLHAMSYAPTD